MLTSIAMKISLMLRHGMAPACLLLGLSWCLSAAETAGPDTGPQEQTVDNGTETTESDSNGEAQIDWAAVTPAANVPARFKPLVDNSPFITPAFRERMRAGRERGRARIIFHGYARLGEEWVFSLLNTRNGQHYLLPMNKEEDGIRVTGFNENEQRLQLIINGNATELGINPL